LIRQKRELLGLVALIGAGLMVYAQTWAFAWDEGFHLLAAQLILKGMRPYIDFFHAQTPLYAYWNAFWMKIFGDTWHTAHAVSTVCTMIALWLTGTYVFDRFDGGIWRQNWRLPMATAAVLLTGLNSQVVQFATIGQAYAICLLAVVAAFRFTVANVKRDDARFAFGAGFFAGVAAASSLLTVPMGPVLFVWTLRAPGAKLKRMLAFIAGGLIPFLPLLRLFLQAPKVVFFGAVKYHLFYRTVDWSESEKQNADIALGWVESPHAMVMALLLLLSLRFMARNAIPVALRRELWLCLWLAVVESAYLLYVRPTFSRYYVFIVPFVAIVSVVGFYYAGITIGRPNKPDWILILLTLLMCLGVGRTINGGKTDYRWPDWDKLSKKVNEVTRAGGLIDADEAVFFITRRTPPSGMEYEDTHKLHLSKELSAQLHVFSKEEMARRVKDGYFDTIANCDDDKDTELTALYKQKTKVGDCSVYWDKITR
jgi:hypothetical protein